MYGGDLLTTPEFQELAKQGFFISGARWKSESTDSDVERVDFSAIFKNATEGKDFVYKIMGVYRLDDTGKLKETKENVIGEEKKKYLSLLENSAYKALNADGDTSNESSKSN